MEPVTLDDTSPYIRYDETWTAALSTSSMSTRSCPSFPPDRFTID